MIGQLLLLAFTLFFSLANANKPGTSTPDEWLKYEVSYSPALVWIKAGEFTFNSSSKTLNSIPVKVYEVKGGSLSSYDWFFRVRNQIKVVVDAQQLKPFIVEKQFNHNGHISDECYNIDYPYKKIYYTSQSEGKKINDTFNFDNNFFDFVSVSYFIRNTDFSQLTINKKVPFYVICGKELCPLYFIYRGNETIKIGNKQQNCIKVSVASIPGSVFRDAESITAWLQNDTQKAPVLVEATLRVGTLKAFLIDSK
jgi:hypothetical protein